LAFSAFNEFEMEDSRNENKGVKEFNLHFCNAEQRLGGHCLSVNPERHALR